MTTLAMTSINTSRECVDEKTALKKLGTNENLLHYHLILILQLFSKPALLASASSTLSSTTVTSILEKGEEEREAQRPMPD